MLKRSLLWCLLPFFGVVLLVTLGQTMIHHSSTGVILQGIYQYAWAFMIGRYSLYAALIYSWPYLIGYMGKQKHWPNAYTQALQKQRLKLFLFLVLIEVFFVYNALGQVLSVM